MTERLDCGSCKFGVPASPMCGVVARRAVAEVAKLGYDTSSDGRPYSSIVNQLSTFDSRVMQIVEQECDLRLLQSQSETRGFGTITY